MLSKVSKLILKIDATIHQNNWKYSFSRIKCEELRIMFIAAQDVINR